jgi:TM2 domain-containing membrane protein YozV
MHDCAGGKGRNEMAAQVDQHIPKNPTLAAILSFLFMGLGQFYNGEVKKGVLFVALYIVSIVLMSFLIGFITTPILWIWGMIDAYKSARKINGSLAVQHG